MTAARARWLTVCAVLAGARGVHAGDPSAQHMLAGAQAFREERYPEALVEFRAAEKSAGGDPGAAWYVAASLVKLNRPEDALVEFARAQTLAPRERDALFDYYHALACYDARLYLCADHLLTALGAAPGPKIAAQALKIHGDLLPLLATPPSPAAIDWYHAQGQQALNANRPALAETYFQEAAALAQLRTDAYRRADALAGAARARQAAPVGKRAP